MENFHTVNNEIEMVFHISFLNLKQELLQNIS